MSAAGEARAESSAQRPLSDVLTRLLEPDKDVSAAALRGARVLVRCDLNTPLRTGADGARVVADRERLDASLPLLRSLVAAGARVVVASHLGRPRPGREPEAGMRARDSLWPVAELLSAALGPAFAGFARDTVGPSARALVAGARS